MRCAACGSDHPRIESEWFRIKIRNRRSRSVPDFAFACDWPCLSVLMRRLTRPGGPAMVDLTDLERAALDAALSPLGDYVASVGMHRPLADYSREEVLALIEVAVGAYQKYLQDYGPEVPF